MKMCTVLIAEDEDEWSDMVSILLPSDRYKVISARTAKEALNMVGKTHPDFAILDLNLPDMFGMDLCRLLHGMPGLKGLPVVALTSLDQARTDGFDGEIDGFVAKRHAANQLLPTVELIRRRSLPAAA